VTGERSDAGRPSLREEIRSLPPAAWVLFAGTVINRFGSFVLVFLVLYLTDRGYSASQAGVAIGTYGAGALVASWIGGTLADRIGRKQTIALSMFTSALTMLALSQAQSLWMIVSLTGMAGCTAELYRPASGALLADLTKPGERVSAFAVYRLAINLGYAIGPAVGGLLAERAFFYIFVGDALTSIVFGAVALLFLPGRLPDTDETHVSGRGAIGVVLADRNFMIFLLVSVISSLVYFQSHSTFPLHVGERFSTSIYGMLVSLNGILILIVELPISSVTRRYRPQPVMALGLVLVGAGFGLTALAGTVPLLAMTVIVWTLGEIIFSPVAAAYVADVAPFHMRGRYQGAWGLSFGVGLVLAPLLGTALYSVSPRGLWTMCFIVSCLAVILIFRTRTAATGQKQEG
jgi:MFS family permease